MPEGELCYLDPANDPSLHNPSIVLPRMKAALCNSDVPLFVPAPHRDIAEPAGHHPTVIGAANYAQEGGMYHCGHEVRHPFVGSLPVREGGFDGEVSGFTKVSSLAEQYEPPTDDEDTAELVKYYEEEVPVAKAVESIINQIVEEAGVPDEVSKQCRADAQENCDSVRSPAPDVATADTAQFSDVIDSLVHDASRWESKYTKMRKKIKPDDGVLVSFWVQMKFAGAEHIMCNYMKVEVLHEPDSKAQPRLKLSLARRRGNDFPCRILSQCQRYLHDEITYLEYGEYELDIARVNAQFADHLDPYERLEHVAQLLVTHRKRGPVIRDVSGMEEDLPYFGELVLSVALDNACNNIELNLDGSYSRRVKNHYVRYSTENRKRRTLSTGRALAGGYKPGPAGPGIPTGSGFFFTGHENLDRYLDARAAVMVNEPSDSESEPEYSE